MRWEELDVKTATWVVPSARRKNGEENVLPLPDMALGAKAILVGRAPLWGLGAFGQPGAERVLWMLGAELKLDMALAGVPNVPPK